MADTSFYRRGDGEMMESEDKLLQKLKRLILDEKKDLNSKEVLKVSEELDKVVVYKIKQMNKERLGKSSKDNLD